MHVHDPDILTSAEQIDPGNVFNTLFPEVIDLGIIAATDTEDATILRREMRDDEIDKLTSVKGDAPVVFDQGSPKLGIQISTISPVKRSQFLDQPGSVSPENQRSHGPLNLEPKAGGQKTRKPKKDTYENHPDHRKPSKTF